jgi:MFS family permease
MLSLLRDNRFARRYFFAHAQSTLGDQLAYIGLVVVAQKTWGSPIMLSVVLMADLLPSALLGSWFGALADHRSRRVICVSADLARAAAFGAIVVFDAPAVLLAAALVAGLGTAAFGPASLSALPTLTSKDQQVGALALHGLIASSLTIAGPFVAAAILFLASPDALFTINAASFLISGAVLIAIPKSAWGGRESDVKRKLKRARLGDYPREAQMNVLATAALALFGGMVGIAEVVLALEVLDSSAAGLAILIAAFGVGFAAAYALTARLTELEAQRQGFLAGAAILSTGLVLIALAPSVWFALPMFALAGLGNGLAVASARLILQQTVSAERLGGIYGIKDSFDASAVAASLLGAGLLVALIGARATFLVAAIGCGLTALWIARGIRRVRRVPSSALLHG